MSSPHFPSPVEEQILEESPTSTLVGADQPDVIAGRSLTQLAWARLKRDRTAMIALSFIVIICLLAFTAPIVVRIFNIDPYQPDPTVLDDATGGLPTGWLQSGISWNHPLGAEPGTGRDIAGMLLYGARISLTVATISTVLVVVLGVIIGTIAGYLGGRTDTVIGRFMDLLLAFPLLLLLLALSTPLTDRIEELSFGGWHPIAKGNPARIVYLILVFSLFGWPYLARIVRGQVISLREREFVESAVAMGSSSRRIIFRELIPNLWAPILVYATLALPTFIAAEAALSFLGVGINPPEVTWGKMLSQSVTYYTSVPTYLFVPGTLLFLVVLAFNIFGDAVRDALDPRAGRV
ncbi:MAG TPA: ABC transporter permease [Actinomycetes bacterium]|nr:ABC transporter permease [Actinomycetes bacterium]